MRSVLTIRAQKLSLSTASAKTWLTRRYAHNMAWPLVCLLVR